MGTFSTALIPTRYGGAPTVTLNFCIARIRNLDLEIDGQKAHLRQLEELREETFAAAKTAGFARQLREALAPPRELPKVKVVRVRVLKAFKVIFRGGRHGSEEWSGGPGGVRDIPAALLSQLRGRVVKVPADTELIAKPLEPFMVTDD